MREGRRAVKHGDHRQAGDQCRVEAAGVGRTAPVWQLTAVDTIWSPGGAGRPRMKVARGFTNLSILPGALMSPLQIREWFGRAQPQQVIAVTAVLGLIFDTFIKPLSAVALGLIVLALSPWLIRFVKTLEMPSV